MSKSNHVGNWYPVPRDQEILFKSIPKPSPKPLSVDTHPVPDSELARAVDGFAKSQLTEGQYNHSRRIYHFGLAILEASFPHWLTGEVGPDGNGDNDKDGERIKVDRETWFCTCLLHDIGLAEAYHLTTKMSFEFKGGIVAREFLLEHGAHQDQADSVCESIILHQDVWIQSGNISLNGQMIILATLFDNAGKFSEYVHQDTIQSVCEAFPRQGWSEQFACAVEKEMREKPWSHTTTFEKPDWRQEGKGSQFGDTARGNDVMRPYD